MKIILFTPGLGNQIFQYLFYLYLRDNYPNQSIYGYYNRKILNKHNGLEVDRVFDIRLTFRIGRGAVCLFSINELDKMFLLFLLGHWEKWV